MAKVCISIRDIDSIYCKFMAETRRDEVLEIRLDKCGFSEQEIKDVFSSQREAALLAAYPCRLATEREDAINALSTAILAGADLVDIETSLPEDSRRWLSSLAMNKFCKTIYSYHNRHHTNPIEDLRTIVRKAFAEGADIVKIVTTAKSAKDAERVLSLYDEFPPERLIAFAMGTAGTPSRLKSVTLGAPLYYVSPRRGFETAPGQPCYYNLLEGEIVLKGEVDIPSSKSFAQRAILLAALAEGTTRLYNLTLCDDTQSALSVAWQLGAEISFEGRTLVLTGNQRIHEKGLIVKDNKLFVGESGLLARLCIPLAGLSDSDITVIGEKTLNRRKIREHAKALRWMGLKITYRDEHYLPATVSGRLNGRTVNISGAHGSQMISGMLIALSQCTQDSVLYVADPTSNPYIDLTIYLAEFFGIEIEFSGEEYEDSRSFFISGKQQIKPLHGLEVEKDWSAAAIMLVAGAMMGDITIRGMDMFSNQADAMIYDFLEQNHVDIIKDNDGNINIRKSIICPFVYDITDAPDLFAPLFLLATRATGESCIQGIRRLRNKESDRARSFAQEFRKLGVWVEIRGDYMLIRGNEDFEFMGAECSSHGDHRLAMVLSIANLLATSEITIDDTDCIDKSFPGFLEELAKLDQRKLN